MSDLQKQEEIKDIKPNECIRRIQSKFQLNGEEIKKIYEENPKRTNPLKHNLKRSSQPKTD